MAIAWDTGSAASATSGFATTLTATRIVASGSNRRLVCGVITAAGDVIASVTDHGNAMTKDAGPITVDSRDIYFYSIANPDVGTFDTVLTYTGFGAGGIFVGSWTGMGAFDSVGSGSSVVFATSMTTSTTVVAANSWGFYVMGENTNTPSAGAGARAIVAIAGWGFFDSNADLAAGSRSMQATFSSDNARGLMASYAPSGGGGGGTNWGTFLAQHQNRIILTP